MIEKGEIDIVLHENGETNLQVALATESAQSDGESVPLNIHLKKIELLDIIFHQREEATGLDIATTIAYARGGFELSDAFINAHVDTEFILDVIKGGDTTYFNNKHFEFHTDLSFNQTT